MQIHVHGRLDDLLKQPLRPLQPKPLPLILRE
jgi:hypothetical protein